MTGRKLGIRKKWTCTYIKFLVLMLHYGGSGEKQKFCLMEANWVLYKIFILTALLGSVLENIPVKHPTNHNVSFIVWMILPVQAVSYPLLPQCATCHTMYVGVDFYFNNVLMDVFGTYDCDGSHHKSNGQCVHHCWSNAPLHGIYILNWKCSLPSGQLSISPEWNRAWVAPET